MAERIFKYQETGELISGVKELGKLLASGSGPTNVLKNSHTGFLKETGAVTQQQVKNYYMNGRYEIFLRGQGVDGNAADANCLGLEPTDPRQEKNMRVVTVYS